MKYNLAISNSGSTVFRLDVQLIFARCPSLTFIIIIIIIRAAGVTFKNTTLPLKIYQPVYLHTVYNDTGIISTVSLYTSHRYTGAIRSHAGFTLASVALALVLVFGGGFDGAAILKRHFFIIAPIQTQNKSE